MLVADVADPGVRGDERADLWTGPSRPDIRVRYVGTNEPDGMGLWGFPPHYIP